MVTELRWILLGLSALLLAGIWWWGARRARLAPKNTEWRESTLGGSTRAEPASGAVEFRAVEDESREWGVPPFEPLSIRTADFDQMEVSELPMTANSDPLDVTLNIDYVEHEVAVEAAPAPDPDPDPEIGHETEPVSVPAPVAVERAPVPSQTPNASETQRIVTVRVSAPGEARWPGSELMEALDHHGLGYGRYKVFHRKHTDGRTLFCAASLVEPGTFDIARMPQEEFRGLTLFAVLPGPAEPLYTIDLLIATAGDLAETLNGVVQDSNGAPLSPQRAEALREDVARFQTVGHGHARQGG